MKMTNAIKLSASLQRENAFWHQMKNLILPSHRKSQNIANGLMAERRRNNSRVLIVISCNRLTPKAPARAIGRIASRLPYKAQSSKAAKARRPLYQPLSVVTLRPSARAAGTRQGGAKLDRRGVREARPKIWARASNLKAASFAEIGAANKRDPGQATFTINQMWSSK